MLSQFNRPHVVVVRGFVALLLTAPTGLLALANHGDETTIIALKVNRIHPINAAPLEGGVIVIRDGIIAALGVDVPIPEGARIIELRNGVATPGLIDAHALIDPETPQYAGEQASSLWQRLGERAAMTAATNRPAGEHLLDAQNDMPLSLRCPEHGNHAAHTDDSDGHDHGGATGLCPLCGNRVFQPLSVSHSTERVFSEQSAEVVPHRLMIDTYNPFANDFKRLLRSGVTTVYLSPDSSCVIGMRGAIVKTGGELGKRIVRRTDAVKISLGSDPSNRGRENDLPDPWRVTFHTRRPTTRMGVEWVARKAFYDARRAAVGLPLHGADMPPLEAIPTLNELLAGKTGVRIQARMQHDIFTALRLADEFGFRFVLEEAVAAYQCLPQLKAAGTPVVFGPLFSNPSGYRAYTGEANDPRLITPKVMLDAGIPFALTANDLRDEDGLVRQAMIAYRYGLPADAALRAITAAPAEIMGLADGFGTLTVGGGADLVVWSTDPLDPASRALLVMIDGQVVYEE